MMSKMELNRINGKKYQDGITVSAHVQILYEVYLATCRMTRHLMLAIYSTGLRLFTFFSCKLLCIRMMLTAGFRSAWITCWATLCMQMAFKTLSFIEHRVACFNRESISTCSI